MSAQSRGAVNLGALSKLHSLDLLDLFRSVRDFSSDYNRSKLSLREYFTDSGYIAFMHFTLFGFFFCKVYSDEEGIFVDEEGNVSVPMID